MIAGGYVVVQEKLPNYVVPDLTDFKVLIFSPFFLNICKCFLIALSFAVDIADYSIVRNVWVSWWNLYNLIQFEESKDPVLLQARYELVRTNCSPLPPYEESVELSSTQG